MDKVAGYLSLLTQALQIGEAVYAGVHAVVAEHAPHDLTTTEYADLLSRWSADKLRAAANAGIDFTTGKPFLPPTE